MANYYLDIETNGFNPKEDKIITIQYQKLGYKGNPEGDLIILKEWKSSEEEIVKKFYKVFITENVWDFVPFLTNHIFDLRFLFEKFNKYNLKVPEISEFLFEKPFIDIKYTLVIANNLSFRGSGLDQMTNKTMDGKNIPIWYESKEYDKIEDYIKMETKSFLEFFNKCVALLPTLKRLK